MFYIDTSMMIAVPTRMGLYPEGIQLLFQGKCHSSSFLKAEINKGKKIHLKELHNFKLFCYLEMD